MFLRGSLSRRFRPRTRGPRFRPATSRHRPHLPGEPGELARERSSPWQLDAQHALNPFFRKDLKALGDVAGVDALPDGDVAAGDARVLAAGSVSQRLGDVLDVQWWYPAITFSRNLCGS